MLASDVADDYSLYFRYENNIIKFKNANYSNKLGAINVDKMSGLNIIACKIKGFTYGVLANSLENTLITANTFENLYIGGIKVNVSTKNSTFTIVSYLLTSANIF